MTNKETIEKAKEEVAKQNDLESWKEFSEFGVFRNWEQAAFLALQLQREEIKKELREKIEGIKHWIGKVGVDNAIRGSVIIEMLEDVLKTL